MSKHPRFTRDVRLAMKRGGDLTDEPPQSPYERKVERRAHRKLAKRKKATDAARRRVNPNYNPVTGKVKRNRNRMEAYDTGWTGRPAEKDIRLAGHDRRKYHKRPSKSDYNEFTSSQSEENYWRRAYKIAERRQARRRKARKRSAQHIKGGSANALESNSYTHPVTHRKGGPSYSKSTSYSSDAHKKAVKAQAAKNLAKFNRGRRIKAV